ncbi:plexin-C1 [Misgurnus anguillicaudatus]|uniref:plexin-C1 n=1 Tax=Misgurnus anguillicaudatus TaxID=75329 RepID=UPI003CCFC933
MRGDLLGLLFLLKYCICGDVWNFGGDIRDFVVGNSKLFVLTGSQLHQMTKNLSLEKTKNFNATHPNTVTLLVPFEANDTLITCGTSNGGYCEVLDLNDITNSIYKENLSTVPQPNEKSVAFIVNSSLNKIPNGAYLLVGRKADRPKNNHTVVALWSTLESQPGFIFSPSDYGSTPCIRTERYVEFIDGFQIILLKLSYLFLNAKTESGWQAFALRLNNAKGHKKDILKSITGTMLKCCNDTSRPVLVASALISSDKAVIWTGVFSAQNDPEDTALAVYDLSNVNGKSKDFCFTGETQCERQTYRYTNHTPVAVVFKYKSMSSVAAFRSESWIELFIGTKDGQLIKLVLDESFRPGCPTVLYRSDDDQKVLYRMHLDSKHIYIALKNQIRRVPVVQCAKHRSLKDCRGALDPFCGWCSNLHKCSTQDECSNSSWISLPKGSVQKQLFSFQVAEKSIREIILHLTLSLGSTQNPAIFSCAFTRGGVNLCDGSDPAVVFPNCSCSFSDQQLSTRASVTVEDQKITETLMLKNCSSITDHSTKASYTQCVQCVSAGCHWLSSVKRCDWTHGPETQLHIQDVCKDLDSETKEPEILSIEPNRVSFHGRNNVLLTGKNLESVTKIRIQGDLECFPKESPVFNRSNDRLRFHVPPSKTKGTVKVCAVTEDDRCHGNSSITYSSQPSCTEIKPKVTWKSGGRKIYVQGNNLEFVESIIANNELKANYNPSSKDMWFLMHPYDGSDPIKLKLKVGNVTLDCANLTQQPDPEFIGFKATQVSNTLTVTIEKKPDNLSLSIDEVNVTGLKGEKEHKCDLTLITHDVIGCEITQILNTVDSLNISVGNVLKTVYMSDDHTKYSYILVALILLIILGALVGVVVYRKNQNQMHEKMNKELENMEMNIRRDIRQGFVDLQTEKSDLIENVGAIPFLDFKHFASKIFFPEAGSLAGLMIKDIGQESEQTTVDEKCQAFATLIRNKQFLTCFVHALEEQKDFSIKDKCTVASLLTLALHGDLIYLTEIMEDLLQSLMDQTSNANPKLLLRRTESIVEKLLTNWMSICLYGFLRESVGQPLFLLVSALIQQISKGPVDSVTEKALYTLNEDWLLCQAQDFEALKLKVLFAVGNEGEVSEILEVNALTCDTIHQVKEKILQTFQRKFGFQYTQNIRDIEIEYEKKTGNFIMLQEVDETSEVREHFTMLNTLKHYEVTDGACIKVLTNRFHASLRSQSSVKDDKDFCIKYFHLVDPDIYKDQSKHSEKKEVKFKEVYLTKLLSTKVAIHSFVESLFRSIWGLPNNRAPLAVKYFFDFLDAQADRKKISDPDVLHIWKTNSLPLRFWVNILKNPDFVFSDMEKTPHLDSCLSVIAQAFMDSFSLAEQPLGKYSPTNKLLYAKDIPQYKQEVKAYYMFVKDQPLISSQEFNMFLQEESRKHGNEFNESAALRELYKYMLRYFKEIYQKLEQMDAPNRLKEDMHKVKDLFDSMKRSAWN